MVFYAKDRLTGTGGGGGAPGALFSMVYGSGDPPNYGWGSARSNATHFSTARVAGGGPSGRDCVEITHVPGDYLTECNQFSGGWTGTVEGSTPAQGQSRYFRYYFRADATTTGNKARGTAGACATETGIDVKMIIHGTDDRIIHNYTTQPSGINMRFAIGIDGGVNQITAGNIANGTWCAVQGQLISSSTASTADGGYRIWISNDTVGSPDADSIVQFGGRIIRTTGWTTSGLWDFVNVCLSSDGVHKIRIAGYQYDDAFDPSFFANM